MIPFTNCSSARFTPNCIAVMGAMLTAFTVRPLYSAAGERGIALPSWSAFFIPTVGCMMHTSRAPLNAPIAVCSIEERLAMVATPGGRADGRAGRGGGGVGWKKLRQIKGREKRFVATDTVQGMSAEAQGAGFAVVVFEVKASSAAL